MLGRICWAALFLWMCAARFSPARADQSVPTAVRVVLAECENIVTRSKLVEHLRIELLATGVQTLELVEPEKGAQGANEPQGVATLQVYYPQCDDDSGVVNLRISDRLTAKYVERALFVGDVSPRARARTVALAIVELLRATWLELVIAHEATDENESAQAVRNRMITRLRESVPDSAPPAAPVATPPPSVDPQSDPFATRWYKPRLEWIGSSRLYAQGGTGDLATAVSTSLALSRRIRMHTGGLAAGGGTSTAQHDVHLFEAAGQVGVGVSGGNEYEIEFASVFEVGWARLNAAHVRDQSSVLVIGEIQAMLRTSVSRGVDVIMGVQGGYVLLPVMLTLVSGQGHAGITGPMIGVSFGLSGIL